jgi:virulence-associated protein VapD
MTNLEQLKQDLANLTERVNCAMTLTDGSIYLTRKQLESLINIVQHQTLEYIQSEIDDIRFDEDDYVDLDLCGREIELNFDGDKIIRDIKHHIGGPEDIEDTELNDLIEKIRTGEI